MKNNKLVKLISAFIIGVVFILTVMSVLIVTGVISVGKADLTLKTGSKDALYDGSPLTNHEFEMIGELKDGHRIEYEFISSQTVVGESPNELRYKIYDELDADVTADYSIKHEYGTLKVNPRIVLVICEDTKNRAPREDEYYVDEEAYDGLVYDHKLVFRETLQESSDNESSTGEETTAAQSSGGKKWKPVIFDRNNNDVTSNYHIIVNVNINNGSSDNEIDDGDETVDLDGGELAEKIFDSDTNLIPPVGNENVVLFSVKSDNQSKLYLKMESYGEYDGQGWKNARNYYHLMQDAYSASYLTAAALQSGGIQGFNASIISHCGKYALPYYLSLTSNTTPQPSDVVYSGSTDSEYKAMYYFYNSAATLPSELADYEAAYSEFVREQYLKIDDTSLEYMKGIIESEGFDVNDPDIVNKVAKYIQGSADYNLKYDRELDEEDNVAIAFLEYYREGVCSHYASAATLLYRALGIPARYTVGVVAYPDGENYVNVPAKNAHAWVEVYYEGLGWVYVEVTGTVAGNKVEVGQSPAGGTECELYGHDMRDVDAKEPNCTEIGWCEHSMCAREDCDYREGYEEIPELGHDKKVVFALDPTCVDEGHEQYVMCSRCPAIFTADGETELEEIPTIDPLGHDKIWVERVEPTCVDEGAEGHYACTRCPALWAEDMETPIEAPTAIDPLGHDKVWVDKVEPTCVDEGAEEHYACTRCSELWAVDMETPIEAPTAIDPLGHDKVWVDRVDPTCIDEGIDAYYACTRCPELWEADMETPIEAPPVLDPLGHDKVWVERVEPTCVDEGAEAHYACTRCPALWDIDAETPIEAPAAIDPLGHDKIWVDPKPATCTEGGVDAYYACTRCDCVWDVDGETPLYGIPEYMPLGHDKYLVERIEPTCIDDGVEAYYACTRCDCRWEQDGETPLEYFPVIPALGHDLVHVDAVEPDCLNGGNKAYCYCNRCKWIFDASEQVVLDKIPLLDPLGHSLKYVTKMEPTCTLFGCEAYYACMRCDAMWAEDGKTEIEEIPLINALGHLDGKPRADEHCNVYCERCDALTKENMHPDKYVDTQDGNKIKCTNCHDVLKTNDGGGGGKPDLDRIIYTVITSTNSPIYLREKSLNYVGEGFDLAPEFWEVYDGSLPYSPNYLASLVAQSSGGTQQTITILQSVDGGYGLPTFMWLGGSYEIQTNDVTYQGDSSTPYTVPFFEYNFLSGNTPTVPNNPILSAFEKDYCDFVYNTYLGMDTTTEEMALRIVASQGWSYDRYGEYSDKIAVINSVANFVKTYRVYDSTYMAKDFDDVSNWAELFFDKENNPDVTAVCRHYAASAVVLYKALGIPARYVSGVSVRAQANEATDIKAKYAHAWVEIYLDGIGWIIVDPTGTNPDPDGDGEGDGEGEPGKPKPTVIINVGNDKIQYQGGAEITYTNENLGTVSGLPKDYTCTFKVIGWATEPGKHKVLQAYNVVIRDENGNNVTGKYNVVKNDGYLQVYRDTLYFTSNDYVRIFDGKTPSDGVVTHTKGVLANGHTYKIIFTANSGVGTFANSFTVKVFEGNKDVSDQYLYKFAFGEVTTSPKPVVLTAGSATQNYNGTELTCHEIYYEVGGLVDGHRLDLENCQFEGSQTNPGTSVNKITKVVIVDSNGKDVSDWYEKTYLPGSLTVIWGEG